MSFLVPPAPIPSVPVFGSTDRFPVRRIFCIGRNYADHAKEMGLVPTRDDPTFFTKPADAIVTANADVPYPPQTADLHYEVEMVVALGSGGANLDARRAREHVIAYGVGLDMTRRDLQASARVKGMPWDTAKAFDASAPISALRLVSEIGHPGPIELRLEVDGVVKQRERTSAMLFDVGEILAELSKLWTLQAGDLVFTGTPAGVGAIARGQSFVASLGDIAELRGKIV